MRDLIKPLLQFYEQVAPVYDQALEPMESSL